MKSKYFELREWVRPEVLEKYGDFAWNFLDPRLIETMDFIRQEKGKPIFINQRGLTQRGLRDNRSPMVKDKRDMYLSAHCLGKACDFNVEGEHAYDTRAWIMKLGDTLPHKIRLEQLSYRPMTWVHIDLYTFGQSEMIKIFDV